MAGGRVLWERVSLPTIVENAIQQEYTWTQNTNTYMSGIDEKAWDEKATITRGISTLKTGKAK